MSAREKITKWRNVGKFCVERAGDYGELLGVEFDETKRSLIRELSSLVALAVAALFTLSFLCIAIIATAWQTPYFLQVVWGVAAAWLVITILSLLIVRAQKPGRSIHILHKEIQNDLAIVKEALK